MNLINKKIGIIGLGYVGLPLAVAFSKNQKVIGFDLNTNRITELGQFEDKTNEIGAEELRDAKKNLYLTSSSDDLKDCKIYIVTVPTPVDASKTPDLSCIRNACKTIGKYLKEGDVVIFESTVYPGATEEVAVPILEQVSRLKFNINFYCGYSPERANPGDKVHRLTNIIKVTSGSTHESALAIDELYKSIIKAGTYRATSIKVAEAAKVIENTQRDLNIALINELSLIFSKMQIDTNEVLSAASTKWNFLNFKPGLVGGHCIGVDPYYLTHKAQELGYIPDVILAGRRINDQMGKYVASVVLKFFLQKDLNVKGRKILILGFTFKEDCPDIRNTKVFDIVKELKEMHFQVDIYDPLVNSEDVLSEYGLDVLNQFPGSCNYDGILLAVPHQQLLELGIDRIKSLGVNEALFFDLKGIYPRSHSDFRL
jgi:UDP-N-acetyl-D-galactosamine dehydrogenase